MNPDIWISLITLTALEIVLGIDNVIFISILAGKLPAAQQGRARSTGLSLALITRVLLLLSLSWRVQLTSPLFKVFEHEVAGRDLILLGGGLFLLIKSSMEIHEKLEKDDAGHRAGGRGAAVGVIMAQIVLLDIVFSLDSVITAVGMANNLAVMIAAVVIAVGVMLVAAGPISTFVERHPTLKMLALSFLLLSGVSLVAEGFDQHISKEYLYFAMALAVFVEMLNLRLRHREERRAALPPAVQEPQVSPAGNSTAQ
jgi:predicted tellurium resistance membrane protein TerC